MKGIGLLLFAFILSISSYAQRNIQMRNMWTRPQVHVVFNNYTLSFTVKDINKALALLAEAGDSSFGLTSGLDTGKDYTIELFPGTKMEYLRKLEPLMQNGVGAFLLSAGHAYVEDKKHRALNAIIMDAQPLPGGVEEAYILFYDPRNNNMIFSGRMAVAMYNKDLGID